MNIYRHYRNGTTHITPDGEYRGYTPNRTDTLLHVSIHTDGYRIDIHPDALIIAYKNVYMVKDHSYTVGRWTYPIETLDSYKYTERRRLNEMAELLNEIVNESSILSVPICDYHTIEYIRTMNE